MIHAATWGQHKGSRPGANPTGRPQRGQCSHECWAAKDFSQPSCYGDFSISLPQERTAVTGHFPPWPGLGWGTRMGAEGLSAAGFGPQSVSLHLGAGLSRGPASPRSRLSPRVPPHRQRASAPPASPSSLGLHLCFLLLPR